MSAVYSKFNSGVYFYSVEGHRDKVIIARAALTKPMGIPLRSMCAQIQR